MNMRKRSFSRCCTLIAMILLAWINSTSAQISQQEARADIQELASAQHGLDQESGAEIMALVEKVKNNPETYLAVISQDLVLPAEKDSLTDEDFNGYYATLVEILKEIGNQEAKNLLKQAYFETADRLDSVSAELVAAIDNSEPQEVIDLIARAESAVAFLHGGIISVFESLNDNSILLNCLDRLERQNYSIQATMFNYFRAIGTGDSTVISRLEEVFLDENSSLLNDPVLKNVLINLGSQLFVPPSLTSLDPDTVTAGSEDFALTVVGANFFNGAVIHWNSIPRNTTFISTTQLQAVIPATDIDSVGTASVTVINPVGTTSNSLILTIIEAFPISDFPAALTISSVTATAAFVGDNFTITGYNHNIDGTPANDGDDVHGIVTTTATARQGILATLLPFQRDNINGSGGAEADVVTQTLSFNVAAFIDNVLAHVDQTAPILMTGTFGNTSQPMVVHASHGVQTSANVTGTGILLVDGPLFVSGNFNWTGLIIHRNGAVSGPAMGVSTSLTVTGGMLVYNTKPFAASLQVSNQLAIRASQAALDMLRTGLGSNP